ncbi:MAG: YaaR family protein [bacterium]|nr:YaaR family protein [bacterium]
MKTKKVSGSFSHKDSSSVKRGSEKASVKNTKFTPFVEELESIAIAGRKKHLDQLLTSLDRQAKIFIEKPIYENLLTYKELVQTFMKETIDKSYEVKERVSRRSLEKQKIYFIVEKVNKDLEYLTEKILSNHSETINLIAKMDEIRGLLLDLYH